MEERNLIKKTSKQKLHFLIVSLLLSSVSLAQLKSDTTIIAGPQYGTSKFHQWLWGKHYRREWATPVRVPVIQLDTVFGGLTPYEGGGGRQSKSLKLRNSAGREYVLRSIDKTFGRALPEIYQNTFIETVINDQVSIAHPYAAITISPMAEAAKIYHTIPQIVFIPQQKALDTFNAQFSNTLYLLEQRPDGDWESAANFGNSKKIIGTDKLLEEVQEHHACVDQLAFLRARLFDLLIGDWGRHEDQWRWAEVERNGQKTFLPIPRDRDQAYTKFDGALLKTAISVAGLGHLQSFSGNIKDVNEYSFPARFLDRRFLNELSLEQWVDISRELQGLITDKVIENAIRQLPPNLYTISGKKLIATLKMRRNKLERFAREYYAALSKEVEVTGTKKDEFFNIKRLDNEETSITIYGLNKDGERDAKPIYSRVFRANETKEVRIYGMEGNDRYNIEGESGKGPKIRIIGGIEKDRIVDKSSGKTKTIIYDNPGNTIRKSPATELHISSDTAINKYQYDAFHYNKKGFQPAVFYNYEDKFFVGLAYGWKNYKWRREPMANEHRIAVHYSIPQNAASALYKGTVYEFLGQWNLNLDAQYDFIRWTNFFGLGNETPLLTKDNNFYRMRSRYGTAGAGLSRSLGKYHALGFRLFYETVQLIDDRERFLAKKFLNNGEDYKAKHFGGAAFNYTFQKLDDNVVPTKGFGFQGNVSYTQNLQQTDRSVMKYSGDMDVYVPLRKNLVLAMHTGAATLSGEPEFYQYNSIGGRLNLRGYRRDRFWAKTTFYNSNELQWLFDLKSFFVNGKFGLIALYDQGRVWHPGENSDLWHRGFGGGFMIAPFHKLAISVTYAKSKEIGLLHLRFNR